MNVGHHLTQAAARWPDKTAIIFEGKRYSYAEFNRLSNRAANAFAAQGIRPGDRVAFITWNLPEQIACFYGLMKMGAVPVPINYRLAPNELKFIIQNAGARMVVFDDELVGQIAPIVPDLDVLGFVNIGTARPGFAAEFYDFIGPAADTEPTLGAGWDDTAFIMYTSGTTGLPKGVLRSHRAETIGAMMIAQEVGFRHTDTCIHNKPLFHIAQLQLQVLPFIMIGGTAIITRGFDVEETMNYVVSDRITVLHGVPTQLVMMMQQDLSKYDLSSLRTGFFGGQNLNDETTRAAMSIFKDRFLNLFGMTEALTCTGIDYFQRPDRIGSVGHTLPSVQMRIIKPDATDPNDVVAPGELGQVIMKTPAVMDGYLGLPEKTAAVLKDGWYFTGDGGNLDDEGGLYVHGRMDFTIKSGGENIHPSEVENVLFRHPAISDAAVIGMPDAKWGDMVTAAVVRTDPDLSADALDRWCRESPDLADFKRPRKYFFVDEIPSNSTGKVERIKLKNHLMSLLEPQAT
ncbi:class I adenylate-forming enzyme family protein [Pseudooceanicola sp. MF1-13]|uniref:class I adenylate-forming enzyme family protein n=1 Tax=Pseudooceanicola sp. MF1-13 TaxID=3379095 RepID=UPI0038919133